MGDIADRFAGAFRDYAVEGVPASGPHEPAKAEIRNIGRFLDQAIGSAVAGLKLYATKALLDADTTQRPGTLAHVYDDATPAKNGIYHYETGGWVVDTTLSDVFFGAAVQVTGDKNLFDAGSALVGNEIEFSGRIGIEANSIASQPIYVGDFSAITISGLAPNPAIDRVYAFYNDLPIGQSTFVSYGQIRSIDPLTLPIPDGAKYFAFSPKQRQSGAVSIANVQVEAGVTATAYQPFTPRILTVAGQVAGQRPEPSFAKDAVFGGAYNLFDVSTARVGGEIQFNGGLYGETNSVASAPIFVGDLSEITFSGMAANPAIARVYAFYSALPTAVNAPDPALVSYGQIPAGASYTVSVPAGARYMRFSPRQRQADAGDYTATQVEPGAVATAFRPYQEAVVEWSSRNLGRQAGGGSAQTSIGVVAIFGDSITATENVEAGQYTYGSGWSQNWPDYALPMLSPTNAYNFARGGAAFANYSGAVPWQRFHHQLDVAFAQSFTPDCVIVALGINDLRFQQTKLGNYDTAMGKAYNALDLTVSIEAARAGFYRLQQQWPDAVKFVSLPLQQAQLDGPTLQAWGALIARMAARYGFTVIDAFSEAGIVADFEVSGGQGRDLYDGLHTDASGQRKQGRLIGARVRARVL
ncbi:SGNH/GDSL hydrolase family protein [Sphingomonas sp. Leaf10]|uniref:SGNH/GDSL hydrolase family protein n=1 Tax=Sphingomonas sp. Leaf10 TaxID=1735676 RepID=UPI000AAAF12D|nr:SGNH/GDSL hydrolase family protein [Sphingomonas sp. Leaf10]